MLLPLMNISKVLHANDEVGFEFWLLPSELKSFRYFALEVGDRFGIKSRNDELLKVRLFKYVIATTGYMPQSSSAENVDGPFIQVYRYVFRNKNASKKDIVIHIPEAESYYFYDWSV